jgi:hypothetical protein
MTAKDWQMLEQAVQQIRAKDGDREAAYALLRLLLEIAEPFCSAHDLSANGESHPVNEVVMTFLKALRDVKEHLLKDEKLRLFIPTRALTPEIRAWALEQVNEEETIASLQEVREKGGRELGELIRELEQEVSTREHRSPA